MLALVVKPPSAGLNASGGIGLGIRLIGAPTRAPVVTLYSCWVAVSDQTSLGSVLPSVTATISVPATLSFRSRKPPQLSVTSRPGLLAAVAVVAETRVRLVPATMAR